MNPWIMPKIDDEPMIKLTLLKQNCFLLIRVRGTI